MTSPITPEQAREAIALCDLRLSRNGTINCKYEEDSKVLTVLLSLAKEGEKMRWRPIESAPRDEDILVTNGTAVGEAHWYEQGFFWAHCHPTDSYDGMVWLPTHWMPLPQPSAPDTKGEPPG